MVTGVYSAVFGVCVRPDRRRLWHGACYTQNTIVSQNTHQFCGLGNILLIRIPAEVHRNMPTWYKMLTASPRHALYSLFKSYYTVPYNSIREAIYPKHSQVNGWGSEIINTIEKIISVQTLHTVTIIRNDIMHLWLGYANPMIYTMVCATYKCAFIHKMYISYSNVGLYVKIKHLFGSET